MTTASAALRQVVVAWLDELDPAQRQAATYPFESAERFAWDYRPGGRGGLCLAAMRAEQRTAAMAVVATAMSARGAAEVAAIIALEPILGAIERAAGRSRHDRDPALYWFAVFGDPDVPGGRPWSWHVGGHHVSIHLTVVDGDIVGSTPSFLGANPAVVPAGSWSGEGARPGSRALTGEETLARVLVQGLSSEQRAIAIVDPVAPPDIHSGNGARADLRAIPSGIRHDDLTPAQQSSMDLLIQHYLGRTRDEVADGDWQRVVDGGLDPVTFGWAGPIEPGLGHYYAIRGPRFLIEYDNTQDSANHIHAVWRDLTRDWGEDVLAAHYREGHTGASCRPAMG